MPTKRKNNNKSKTEQIHVRKVLIPKNTKEISISSSFKHVRNSVMFMKHRIPLHGTNHWKSDISWEISSLKKIILSGNKDTFFKYSMIYAVHHKPVDETTIKFT